MIPYSQLGYFQTWLHTHNASSQGVEIDDILEYARRTKERGGGGGKHGGGGGEVDSETVRELRATVASSNASYSNSSCRATAAAIVAAAAAVEVEVVLVVGSLEVWK